MIEVRSQGIEGFRVERVQAPGALRPVYDEMGVLQDAQVLRDCRPADREIPGELTDRQRAVHQTGENSAPGPVAESGELGVLVSNH